MKNHITQCLTHAIRMVMDTHANVLLIYLKQGNMNRGLQNNLVKEDLYD